MKEEVIQSLAFVNDVVYSNHEIKIMTELPDSKKQVILVVSSDSHLYSIYKNKIKKNDIIGFKAKLNDIKQYSPSNLYVLDKDIEWSKTTYKDGSSLVHHVKKHPKKERYIWPWEEKPMNIDYSNFDTIKTSYYASSKKEIISRIGKREQWEYSDDRNKSFNINYENNLRICVKYSPSSKPVIASSHFRDKKDEEICKPNFTFENFANIPFFNLNCERNYENKEYLYSCAFNYLRKLKYRKTRFFKDVPRAFYASDKYDFYETIDNIEKLVLFSKLLYIDEYNNIAKYDKLKQAYIDFIDNNQKEYGNDNSIKNVFKNLENFNIIVDD